MTTLPPNRRSVLLGSLALGGFALLGSGCDKGDAADKETAAKRVLNELLASELALIDWYNNHPEAPGAQALLADHLAHADGLRDRMANDAPTPSASVPPTFTHPESGQAAERAMAELAAKNPATSADIGDIAELCASLAACEYSHIAMIGGTVNTKPEAAFTLTEKSAITAANKALGAIHAAIYGYGVAGAHLRQDARTVAEQALARLRQRREALIAAIKHAGTQPASAQAAYTLPFAVTDHSTAVLLGVHMEQATATTLRATAGVLTTPKKEPAVLALAECAITAATWRRLSGETETGVTELGTVAWPGS